MVIQALTKRGVYQRDIAEMLTVQRALNRGGALPPHPRGRPSLLNVYRAEVDRRFLHSRSASSFMGGQNRLPLALVTRRFLY